MIPQFEEGNIPTLKWTSKFIKREMLTHRLSQNLKVLKAEISQDVIMKYFNLLKKYSVKKSPSY